MLNDESKIVDLYIPRKCSVTGRLIPAHEHGAVQLNVGEVDENGHYNGKSMTFIISGHVRQLGESDSSINRLLYEKNVLTFAS